MTALREFIRTFRALYVIVQDSIIGFFGQLGRHRLLTREEIPAADPLFDSKLAAIYVHFDEKGLVHDYVVHQLREIVDAGYRITFVSNAPIFPEQSRARIAPFCKKAIWRVNTGYDFGAYKDGIASLTDLDDLDGLVLMNDSVYGPFWNLANILSEIDRSKVDFWGISDSWEHQYHLQTYFMLFFPKALQATSFRQFWKCYPYINNKRWVIRNGEVKLTQALAKQQLRGTALVPYWSAVEKMKDRLGSVKAQNLTPLERRVQIALLRGQPLNSMHYFWELIIVDYRCPFIKRELLEKNPAGVPLVSRWPDVIRSHSGYDVTMIEKHLQS